MAAEWRTLTAIAGQLMEAPVTRLRETRSGVVYNLVEPGRPILWVGSDAEVCGLVIDHPTVSRRQAFLEFRPPRMETWLVAYPGAKNPLWIDGVLVERGRLRFGSRVQFGDLELLAFAEAQELEDRRAWEAAQRTSKHQAARELGVPRATLQARIKRAETLFPAAPAVGGLAGAGSLSAAGVPRPIEVMPTPKRHRAPPFGVPVIDEGDRS